MKFNPRPYQSFSIEHIIQHEGAGLFLEMGLGKTVSAATAMDMLLNTYLEISKPLIIAPKKVAESVWSDEFEKWEHLRHLKLSKILGTEKQRLAALRAKADVYIINRENVVWLVSQCATHFPFDMVIIDELSSFKSATSARFKALRQVRPLVKRVVGLTGTPAPNGLLDLWAQLYLLDMGERLENTFVKYREKYFKPADSNRYTKFEKFDLAESDDELEGPDINKALIYDRIKDICVSMKARDYLDLPKRIDQVIHVDLPMAVYDRYEAFEEERVMELDNVDLEEITAVNKAALITKLLQFANGAVYDADGVWHHMHDEKLDALAELIEAANGQPVLIAYAYKHDLERIKERLKAYHPVELKGKAEIDAWNRKEIPVMLTHPASAGHGLNLQFGGHIIIWFGNTYSCELFQQFNARLDRSGQTESVIIYRLCTRGTVDEEVIKAVDNKVIGQDGLMQAVKAIIEKHRKKIVA
jgi:SNF2 family DNA or RNA helicase